MTGYSEDVPVMLNIAEALHLHPGWYYHLPRTTIDKHDVDSAPVELLSREAQDTLGRIQSLVDEVFTRDPPDSLRRPPAQKHGFEADANGGVLPRWLEGLEPNVPVRSRLTQSDVSHAFKETFVDVALGHTVRDPQATPLLAAFVAVATGRRHRLVLNPEAHNWLSILPTRVRYPKVVDVFGPTALFAVKLDVDRGFRHVVLSMLMSKLLVYDLDGHLLRCCRLPFGLDWGPRAFCTLLNNILEDAGIKDVMVVYVDDILIAAATPEAVLEAAESLIAHCSRQGVWISLKKSFLRPCSVIAFLGMVLSLRQASVRASSALIARTLAARDALSLWKPGRGLCVHDEFELRSSMGKLQFIVSANPLLALVRFPIDRALSFLVWTEEAAAALGALSKEDLEAPRRAIPADGPTVVDVCDASVKQDGSAGAAIRFESEKKPFMEVFDLRDKMQEFITLGLGWSSSAAEAETAIRALLRPVERRALNRTVVSDAANVVHVALSQKAPRSLAVRKILDDFYGVLKKSPDQFTKFVWQPRTTRLAEFADSGSELQEDGPVVSERVLNCFLKGWPRPTHQLSLRYPAAKAGLIPSFRSMAKLAARKRVETLRECIHEFEADPFMGFAGCLQWRPDAFEGAKFLLQVSEPVDVKAFKADVQALHQWFRSGVDNNKSAWLFIAVRCPLKTSDVAETLTPIVEMAGYSFGYRVDSSRRVFDAHGRGGSAPMRSPILLMACCTKKISLAKRWPIRFHVRDWIDRMSGEAQHPGPRPSAKILGKRTRACAGISPTRDPKQKKLVFHQNPKPTVTTPRSEVEQLSSIASQTTDRVPSPPAEPVVASPSEVVIAPSTVLQRIAQAKLPRRRRRRSSTEEDEADSIVTSETISEDDSSEDGIESFVTDNTPSDGSTDRVESSSASTPRVQPDPRRYLPEEGLEPPRAVSPKEKEAETSGEASEPGPNWSAVVRSRLSRTSPMKSQILGKRPASEELVNPPKRRCVEHNASPKTSPPGTPERSMSPAESLKADTASAPSTPRWHDVDLFPCKGASCSRILQPLDGAYLCDVPTCVGWMVCFRCLPPPKKAQMKNFPLRCPQHQLASFLERASLSILEQTTKATIGRLLSVVYSCASGKIVTTAVMDDEEPLFSDEMIYHRTLAFASPSRNEVVLRTVRLMMQLQAIAANDVLESPVSSFPQFARHFVTQRLTRNLFPDWVEIQPPALANDMSRFRAAVTDLEYLLPWRCGAYRILAQRGAFCKKTHSRKFPIIFSTILTGFEKTSLEEAPLWCRQAMIVQALFGFRGGMLPLISAEHFDELENEVFLFRTNWSHKPRGGDVLKQRSGRPFVTLVKHHKLHEFLPKLLRRLVKGKSSKFLFPMFNPATYARAVKAVVLNSECVSASDLARFDGGITPHGIRLGTDIVLAVLGLSADYIDAHLNWARAVLRMSEYYAALEAGNLVEILSKLHEVVLTFPATGWYFKKAPVGKPTPTPLKPDKRIREAPPTHLVLRVELEDTQLPFSDVSATSLPVHSVRRIRGADYCDKSPKANVYG